MVALQLATILLRLLLQGRAARAAENLALRQQVALLQRSVKRPRFHRITGRTSCFSSTGQRNTLIEYFCWGTHFLHNVIALGIGYFVVRHDTGEGRIDGRSGRGAVLEPS